MGVQFWPRQQVADRILAGETLVIYRNQVLRIPPAWLAAHPGGALAILHFVGRDAADEIDAYHTDHTLRTRVKSFAVGEVELGKDGQWEPLVPPVASGWVRRACAEGPGGMEWHHEAEALPLEGEKEGTPRSQILLVERGALESGPAAPTLATLQPPPTELSLKIQARHSAAYRELHKQVVDAGLYDCPYWSGYGPEIVRYTLLGAGAAFFYSTGWLALSAISLGLFWHQLTFTVHDLGHTSVTHNWLVDRLIGIFIADFLGGISIGWWVNNHNIHHLVTNHPSHDPDIEYLPFFAISPVFLQSLYSSYYKMTFVYDRASSFLLTLQHHLFYVILGFARFNLYALSYGFLIKRIRQPMKAKNARWTFFLEIFCLGAFWAWYGTLLARCGSWQKTLLYAIISNVCASPVHVQIVLSHFSRSTEDLGPAESFFARQLRTTTDVICPSSLQFLHGGLHLQVTHHLFPRLPRHNLLPASKIVKRFAKEQDLEYAEFGFVEGNMEVRGVLRAVAEQVKIIGYVAREEVREAVNKKRT